MGDPSNQNGTILPRPCLAILLRACCPFRPPPPPPPLRPGCFLCFWVRPAFCFGKLSREAAAGPADRRPGEESASTQGEWSVSPAGCGRVAGEVWGQLRERRGWGGGGGGRASRLALREGKTPVGLGRGRCYTPGPGTRVLLAAILLELSRRKVHN